MKYTIVSKAGAAALVTASITWSALAFAAPDNTAAEPTNAAIGKKAGERSVTDRSHPDYLRCRSEPVIGSRARMRKICMTNREWEAYARTGNSDARAMVEDISKGGMRSQ